MRNYIGSGHIAAIVGLSPWSDQVKVWLELTDESYRPEINEKMEAGNIFEEAIAQQYAKKNHLLSLEKGKLVRDGFLGATPDFIGSTETEKFIIECKNTSEYNRKLWEDGVPDHVQIQVQWQMHIVEIYKAVVVVCIGGYDFKDFAIEYDVELGQMLEKHAIHFWDNYVIPKVMPPVTPATDAETIKRLFKNIDVNLAKKIDVPSALFSERERLKSEIKERETALEAIEKLVAITVGNAEQAITNDGEWCIKQSTVNIKETIRPAYSYVKRTIKRVDEKTKKLIQQKLMEVSDGK